MVLEIISDHLAATSLLQKISSLCGRMGLNGPGLQVEVDQGRMRVLAPQGHLVIDQHSNCLVDSYSRGPMVYL